MHEVRCILHGIYRGGASRGREELLWQLNDVVLSKSMLAHATFDAYVSALVYHDFQAISYINHYIDLIS